jgi:hypothetical protein
MTRSRVPTWHVIGRGLAGWHASGVNVSSSGGDIRDGEYWTGEPTIKYLSEAIDGALVYDAREADPDAFTRLIVSGPMVNPALDPAEVSAFVDRYAAVRMAPMLGGEYAQLAEAAQAPTYTGLDYVGVAVYRELLRTVPGIKLGTVRAGVVIWE